MSLSDKFIPEPFQTDPTKLALRGKDVKGKIQNAKKKLKEPIIIPEDHKDKLGFALSEMAQRIDKVFLEEFGEDLI